MQKKLDRNYYAAIGVARDAEEGAIKKAYRQAILTAHPDKGGTDEEFQRVNEAWNCLSDPVKRADYDRVSAFGIHNRFELFIGLEKVQPARWPGPSTATNEINREASRLWSEKGADPGREASSSQGRRRS